MPRCRVVLPEVVRLPLSEGDWIDVKRELNAGEYFDLLTALSERKAFAAILAYVLAWSFVGLDGTALAWDVVGDEEARRSTVRSLDKGTTRELNAVLSRHAAAEDAALEKKKATAATAPASSAT